MSHAIFDQVLIPPPRRRSSRWLKLGSIVVHVSIGLFVVLRTITSAFELPAVHTRLSAVLLASAAVPPVPPEPSAPPVAAQSDPILVASVPLAAPEGLHPEPDRPLPVAALGVAGGIGPGVPPLGATPLRTLPVPPPPPPQTVAPRRIGGDVLRPARTVFVAPTYPPAARAARVEGTVVIEAVIDVHGVVQEVTVLRSVPLLDRAALDAVRQWRYTPTRLNGEAIPVRMTVTVRFSLK